MSEYTGIIGVRRKYGTASLIALRGFQLISSYVHCGLPFIKVTAEFARNISVENSFFTLCYSIYALSM